MTQTVRYAVNSYKICLGQTKIDQIGSGDPDDFRNGASFFVELGVSELPGFRNRFRDHWKQVETFSLYFLPDDELPKASRGLVAREADDNGRILTEAYARFHYSGFAPMQDWLRSNDDITLFLIGEDRNSDSARCRLEGNVVSL